MRFDGIHLLNDKIINFMLVGAGSTQVGGIAAKVVLQRLSDQWHSAHSLHRIEVYCSSEPFYFSLKSRSYGRVQLVRYGNLFQEKVQLPDKTVIPPAPVTITEILIAMSAIIFRRKG